MKYQSRSGALDGILDEVLGGSAHVKILRYLCRTGGEHTGRAIGRAIQVSHPAVHRALRTLAGRMMVQAVRHGPAIAYCLNEEHWLVRTGIRPLFITEAAFFETIGEAVRSVAGVPVRSVILFGSVARGEAGAESDIDLLCLTGNVLAKAGAEQGLADAATRLRLQFGRRFSVMVLSETEFARRYRQREQLSREIVEGGWVIFGKSLSEILRNAR